jgi:hypothetical protein
VRQRGSFLKKKFSSWRINFPILFNFHLHSICWTCCPIYILFLVYFVYSFRLNMLTLKEIMWGERTKQKKIWSPSCGSAPFFFCETRTKRSVEVYSGKKLHPFTGTDIIN